MTRVGTLCGSLGPDSANAAALAVAAHVLTDRGAEVVAVGGLEQIAPFRPDLVDAAPPPVPAFRAAIESVDALLVAAPEYAGGLAGVVKNALDWLVGSGSLYHRVVAVLSAGTTCGRFARDDLVRTVSWQGGFVVATLGIASPRPKRGGSGAFVDPATVAAIGGWAVTALDAVGAPPAAVMERVLPIVTPLGVGIERFGDVG